MALSLLTGYSKDQETTQQQSKVQDPAAQQTAAAAPVCEKESLPALPACRDPYISEVFTTDPTKPPPIGLMRKCSQMAPDRFVLILKSPGMTGRGIHEIHRVSAALKKISPQICYPLKILNHS